MPNDIQPPNDPPVRSSELVMRHRTQTELETENRELRDLVAEMYEWTRYKHTRWATRAAKVLGRDA